MTIKNIVQIMIYSFLSSFGLVILKIGTNKELKVSFNKENFTINLNYILIIGLLFYVLSFITSLITMKGMQLNVFYPVSAGMVYVLVCLFSYFMLHEKISSRQAAGMIIILIGVIIMNVKKT